MKLTKSVQVERTLTHIHDFDVFKPFVEKFIAPAGNDKFIVNHMMTTNKRDKNNISSNNNNGDDNSLHVKFPFLVFFLV